MTWPTKLVCVGMRFRPKENQAVLDKYRGKNSYSYAALKMVANENGERWREVKYAIEVWLDNKHVAYIRNQDLTQGLFDVLALNGFSVSYRYQLGQISTNYFVLNLNTDNTAECGYTIEPPIQQLPYSKIQEINSTKDEKKMMNTNSMRDSFFREVKNVAIDIQSGKFGVVSSDGISVYMDGGVSVNPIQDFGVKIPAFAMRVAVNDLKEGDIILSGNDASFFKAKTDNGYEVVTLNGEVKQVGNVTNLFFGKNTVLAVRNMFGDNMNPMMMALMMGDSKDGFDMKTFALMSMMGGNSAGMDSNMLMMAMMMGK